MRNLEKTTTIAVTPNYSGVGITLGILALGIGLKNHLYFIALLGAIMIFGSLMNKTTRV